MVMKKTITVMLLMVICMCSHAQTIMQVEYAFDVDLGVGQNNTIAISPPQADINFAFTIPSTGLTPGYHKLYLRTKNSDGYWSHTSLRNVEVPFASSLYIVNGGEYFFDFDPGYGNATPIGVSPQQNIILQNFTAQVSGLLPGYHKLFIRTKDSIGNWSQTSIRNVDVINTQPLGAIATVEYFFKDDVGFGNAITVLPVSPFSDSTFTFQIPLSNIPTGTNRLYLRAKESNSNTWSITQWQSDSIVTSSGLDTLWSNPLSWSSNKLPDANTIVILHHKLYVDVPTATCKSFALFRNNAMCILMQGMKIAVTGQ
jgi:hypothetical protein